MVGAVVRQLWGRGSRVAGRSLLSRAVVDVLFVRREILAVFFVVHFARSH